MKILWIPGWSIPLDKWKQLIEPLNNRSFNEEFVDFSLCKNREDFLQLILNKIDQDQEEWILAGWSMGSMLALEAAKLRLNKVKGLFLFSSSLQFAQSADYLDGMPLAVIRNMARNLKRNRINTLTAFYQLMFSEKECAKNFNESFLKEIFAAKSTFVWDEQSLLAGLDYLAHVRLHECWQEQVASIVWLHGTDDQICHFPSLLAHEGTENKKILQLHNAGHVPFYTQLEKVKVAWEDFLDDFYR